MNRTRSAFGVPMTPTMRQQDRAGGHVVRPRARQPYTLVTPTFGPRSAYEMSVPTERASGASSRDLLLGVPAGGWNLGRLDGAPAKKGAEAPSLVPPTSADADPMVALSRYAPAVATTLAALLAEDPRTDMRVYEARVKNMRVLVRSVPPFLRPFFEARLRVVEAKLEAAKEHKALQVESERSTRSWRLIGWAGAGTGIAVGISMIALVLVGARALNARGRAT